MAKQDVKAMLSSLPNTVNGDGRNFVATLKQILGNAKFAGGGGVEGGGGQHDKGLEQVTGLTLREVHTKMPNGEIQNDIEVTFDSSKVTNFKEAVIWVMNSGGNFSQAGIAKASPYTIRNVLAGITYTVKVVAVDTASNTSVFAEAPEASIAIQGTTITPSKPSQLTLVWDKDGPLWQWQDKRGPYDDYYELRLDQNVGVMDDMYLDRTYDMQSRVNPNVRNGTAYLFKRNVFGDYGEPAVHQFNKQAPSKPTAPILEATLDGVVITMVPLPEGFLGYRVTVGEEVFEVKTSQWTYFQFSGSISVSYCFFDDVGNGEQSDVVTMDIKTQIDGTQIANGAVGTNQIAANAIKAGQIDANAVTADKIKAGAVETDKLAAGAVKADNIDANAVTSDKINAGAIIADKIASGAVTADKVSAGAITTPALNAGAVTADKIGVTELSAITATIGTLRTSTSGARTEIKDNLIEVYDENNVLRVRIGVW